MSKIIKKYETLVRLHNPWYRRLLRMEPIILNDIIEHYQIWDDPTFGNGGGDYINCCQTIYTGKDSNQTIKILNKLNKNIKSN